MYDIIKSVILTGQYELSNMIKKIDMYYVQDDITEEEREELIGLAREHANIKQSVDILKKLEEFDLRLKKLESKEEINPENPETEEYPEYVIGKWYYKGDKISFNGVKYICIAPDGVVCTWSPTEYPTYWKKVS